jgi:hypothetical protein
MKKNMPLYISVMNSIVKLIEIILTGIIIYLIISQAGSWETGGFFRVDSDESFFSDLFLIILSVFYIILKSGWTYFLSKDQYL